MAAAFRLHGCFASRDCPRARGGTTGGREITAPSRFHEYTNSFPLWHTLLNFAPFSFLWLQSDPWYKHERAALLRNRITKTKHVTFALARTCLFARFGTHLVAVCPSGGLHPMQLSSQVSINWQLFGFFILNASFVLLLVKQNRLSTWLLTCRRLVWEGNLNCHTDALRCQVFFWVPDGFLKPKAHAVHVWQVQQSDPESVSVLAYAAETISPLDPENHSTCLTFAELPECTRLFIFFPQRNDVLFFFLRLKQTECQWAPKGPKRRAPQMKSGRQVVAMKHWHK